MKTSTGLNHPSPSRATSFSRSPRTCRNTRTSRLERSWPPSGPSLLPSPSSPFDSEFLGRFTGNFGISVFPALSIPACYVAALRSGIQVGEIVHVSSMFALTRPRLVPGSFTFPEGSEHRRRRRYAQCQLYGKLSNGLQPHLRLGRRHNEPRSLPRELSERRISARTRSIMLFRKIPQANDSNSHSPTTGNERHTELNHWTVEQTARREFQPVISAARQRGTGSLSTLK